MPRPKKKPEERRTERINPRFTPAERAQIEQTAARAGMSAAEYARAQTLKGRVNIQSHRTLDPTTFDELRRIGVNLNQLARIANQSGRVPDQLGKALTQLETILSRELGGSSPQARPAHNAPPPSSSPPRPAPPQPAARHKKAPPPASFERGFIPDLLNPAPQIEPGPVPNLIKPASPPPEPEKQSGVAQFTRSFLHRLTGGDASDDFKKAAAEPDKKTNPSHKRTVKPHDP